MKVFAIDTESVECGNDTELARVCIVNEFEEVVLDSYVKPASPVTDYRTAVSGIRAGDLNGADKFQTVMKKVENILEGNILVGHSLKNDLKAMKMASFPIIKDLADEPKFQSYNKQPVSLKELAKKYLGRNIQDGNHDCVEDAKATMAIYLKNKF